MGFVMTDVHAAMQALMSASRIKADSAAGRPVRPVVTISREHGALGRQVAEALSAHLQVPLYDRALIGKIASRLDVDQETAKMLDESVGRASDLWLVGLLKGKDLSKDAWRTHLVNIFLGLSRVGGVILGRGAHLVLEDSCALRLKLVAPRAVRIKRIAERNAVSEAIADQQVLQADTARLCFLKDMFGARSDDPAAFDLVLNTARLDNVDTIVRLLATAYEGIARCHQVQG
ncbi:cytidylate kinase-like family protein [Haematospirillum sp. 15-248]|uniref:cytidylate kinase-like family protein n=1 Tax=Haematospirillum sp. 15-248 TaxID=2723107 RepID=UPI001439D8E8|nr:cytidylate kinase-like family protein [Haematospirillum sp. 15-248]NKD87913.1 cytidylate kinase-like family protein [Haematospirillum sp. 15-248]